MHRKTFLIIYTAILSLMALPSCDRRDGIIPKDVMSEIYYDIYMTDEAIKTRYIFRKMADTMMLYEPIFNKYGYTTEDYNRSVEYYLERPDKFEDVFQATKTMLEMRKSELNDILEAEGRRPRLWPLIDSLELYTADGIHAGMMFKYLRMMFFQADTALPMSPEPDTALLERPYNTFLIFGDSAMKADKDFLFYSSSDMKTETICMIEKAEAARDSLKAAEDSVKVAEAGVTEWKPTRKNRHRGNMFTPVTTLKDTIK
ncbi:MAG TPA: DUF4296 domain-containing protein [Candidatus Coprenecus pullistercoris]|nr:DUF4296 domain-containing protein [Candidatus Coprenecus pullistercoris]